MPIFVLFPHQSSSHKKDRLSRRFFYGVSQPDENQGSERIVGESEQEIRCKPNRNVSLSLTARKGPIAEQWEFTIQAMQPQKDRLLRRFFLVVIGV